MSPGIRLPSVASPSTVDGGATGNVSPLSGMPAVAGSRSKKRSGATPRVSPKKTLPAVSDLILSIRELYRQRDDLLRPEGNLCRQLKSIARRLNGTKETPKDWLEMSTAAAPVIATAYHTIKSNCARVERLLKKQVEQLPVWKSFGEPLRGFGAVMLGQIVGVAGDLDNYSNPAKLWKRFGLGLVNGERQRKCVNAAKAEAHGYSPQRRAVMAVIGQMMLMNHKGEYKDLYESRKAYEQTKGITLGHAHKRAHRYVQKRLLRDLWKAWRAESGHSCGDTLNHSAGLSEAA